MSEHTPPLSQLLLGADREIYAPASADHSALVSLPSQTIYTCGLPAQEQTIHHCVSDAGDNDAMGKHKKAPSREIQRFAWLIEQFERIGIEQKEIARRTGMSKQYISALKNYEATGRTGFGAEIVRRMKDGMGIDPAYFFDDYEDQVDHKVYQIENRRREKAFEEFVKEQAAMRIEVRQLAAAVAQNSLEIRNERVAHAETKRALGEAHAQLRKRR